MNEFTSLLNHGDRPSNMFIMTIPSMRYKKLKLQAGKRLPNKRKRMKFLQWLIFLSLTWLAIFFIITVLEKKKQIFVECSCSRTTETSDKVKRYLPTLSNESINEVERNHPSLALRFLVELESEGQRCYERPGLFDIQHHNNIWQEAQVGFTKFYLFSAFLDTRNKEEGESVRVLVMVDTIWPTIPTCQFYYKDDGSLKTFATRATRMDFLHWDYPKRGELHPYLITCILYKREGEPYYPTVVSVVPDPCSRPSNALRVLRNEAEQKADLVLCTKFLYDATTDFSYRLVEWLETAKAWGVDEVDLRLVDAHPNVLKILKFYEAAGFLKVHPWSNPGSQPNIPSLSRIFYDTQRYSLFVDENIPYTDCLLRHIGTHKYVGVWDIDEFIIPVVHLSIPSLIDDAHLLWEAATQDTQDAQDIQPTPPPTSYLFRTSYFFDDLAESFKRSVVESFFDQDLYTTIKESDDNKAKNTDKNNINAPLLTKNTMLQMDIVPQQFPLLTHTQRTLKYTEPAKLTKAIHDTSRALGLHAHFALYGIEGKTNNVKDSYHMYPVTEGFLGHYRGTCQTDQQECDEKFRPYIITDKTLWKYATVVIKNSREVFCILFNQTCRYS